MALPPLAALEAKGPFFESRPKRGLSMSVVNRILFALFVLILITALCGSAAAQSHLTGTLADGGRMANCGAKGIAHGHSFAGGSSAVDR